MRSNFQQPISKNLQCAVLESWMLLICRKLHWLATAGSCHSLCDTSFVWQLQSFLFHHLKKQKTGKKTTKKKNRVAVKTCLKGSSSPQQQTGRGERRRNTAQQLANMNVSSQEIVRGHLYFTTMISPFHLLLAALPAFSLIAMCFISKKLLHFCSTTLPIDSTVGKRKKMFMERDMCKKITASTKTIMSLRHG